MSTGKLKISYGELLVELEGDNELLYRSFSDMRLDGSFSNLSAGIKAVEKHTALKSEPVKEVIPAESDESVTADSSDVIELRELTSASELPDFNSLILEKKTFTVSAWMLFMAWSVSHKGRIKFSKKQLKKIYCNSCKHIGLRSKDFVSNFMMLLLNDYIAMVEKNTFTLTDYGYKQAYAMLSEVNNESELSEAI